jgi:prealbumin domain-containing protein
VRVLALIRRLRRSVVALGAALGTVFILGVTSAVANLPGSTFEGSDGNLVVNTAGNTDWENAPHRAIGTDLPTGPTDNSFGQGAKEDLVSTTVVSGSIPNSKADLAQFYVGSEQVAAGIFLYLGWTRANTSGTTNFDFELNQAAQPDLTTPGPKTLVRTSGDLLINYLFQGQGTPQINIRTWNGTAWSDPIDASAFSEAAINSSQVANPLPGGTPSPIPALQFGEAALNLTAAGIFPPGVCKAFGSVYVKSRSSTAFSSEIKDFIAPVHVNIANCARIIVQKVTVPSPDPTDTSFSFGASYDADGFSLKNGASNDSGDLNPGTYSVSETVPANWVLTSATCDDGSDPASIGLGPAEIVTCTFTNTLQHGAITVTKMAKHAASGPGDHPLAGVSFTVNGVTQQTGADGTTCFEGLTIGSTYNVTETPPPGYASDDASLTKSVLVDNAATCAGGGGESVSFHNTPLTDLSITVNSQVDGGTASTINCDNGGPNGSTGAGGDGSASATNLRPGTYNCVIVVDP